MTTTYVLHGGATAKDSSDNNEFFRHFTSLVDKEEVKILLCYFARSHDRWEELLKRDEPKIRKNSGKNVQLTVAKNTDDLFHKLKDSDVLYVAGGEVEYLEPYYDTFKDLETALKGKVYIGSSMGAFMVSKSYVRSLMDQDENKVHRGLGILPFSTLCHWNIEKRKEYKINLLKKDDNRVSLLVLGEGKFAVFVK